MARAEPATIGSPVVACPLTERDAAEMCADADDDQPLRLLDSVRIFLRIAQVGNVDVGRRLDFLRCAVVDEDWFAAPLDGQTLTELDRHQIDFGGGFRQGIAGWV